MSRISLPPAGGAGVDSPDAIRELLYEENFTWTDLMVTGSRYLDAGYVSGRSNNGLVYFVGGQQDDYGYTGDIDIFDPATSSWLTEQRVSAPPLGVSGLVLGGFANHWSAPGHGWRNYLVDWVGGVLTLPQGPIPVTSPAYTVFHARIFDTTNWWFAGSNNHDNDLHTKVEFANGAWTGTAGKDLPAGRYEMQIYSDQPGGDLRAVMADTYLPLPVGLTKAPDVYTPQADSGTAAFSEDGSLMVFGGGSYGFEPYPYFFVMDTATRVVTQLPNLPGPGFIGEYDLNTEGYSGIIGGVFYFFPSSDAVTYYKIDLGNPVAWETMTYPATSEDHPPFGLSSFAYNGRLYWGTRNIFDPATGNVTTVASHSSRTSGAWVRLNEDTVRVFSYAIPVADYSLSADTWTDRAVIHDDQQFYRDIVDVNGVAYHIDSYNDAKAHRLDSIGLGEPNTPIEAEIATKALLAKTPPTVGPYAVVFVSAVYAWRSIQLNFPLVTSGVPALQWSSPSLPIVANAEVARFTTKTAYGNPNRNLVPDIMHIVKGDGSWASFSAVDPAPGVRNLMGATPSVGLNWQLFQESGAHGLIVRAVPAGPAVTVGSRIATTTGGAYTVAFAASHYPTS